MATQWRGQDTVKRNMANYARDVKSNAKALAQRYAVDIENYAKNEASWQDRTGNARQALYTLVDDGNGRLIIYLSHGVDYGLWLEVKYQGRYAIIERTLEHFYTPIQNSFRRLLS